MEKITIIFYECEHNGDLQSYIHDVVDSGGNVIDSEINYDAEKAEVLVEVNDKNEFFNKFFSTYACGFSQYQHHQVNYEMEE